MRLTGQDQPAPGIMRMTFEAPDLAGNSRPGQFIQLRVTDGYDPLLRRPFSIHRTHSNGTIEILYRIVGRGTGLLSRTRPGVCLDGMGPLGKPFQTQGDFSPALVAAGGMGSAPAFMLIDTLLKEGKPVHFFWGVRCDEEFFDLEWLRSSGVELHLACERGDTGHQGLITDILEPMLNRYPGSKGFVCGPKPMLAKLRGIIRNFAMPWEVSLEERMACGVGVCMGCAVRVGQQLQMVCSDGPVFDLREVDFES